MLGKLKLQFPILNKLFVNFILKTKLASNKIKKENPGKVNEKIKFAFLDYNFTSRYKILFKKLNRANDK